jgi:hypothetical protein
MATINTPLDLTPVEQDILFQQGQSQIINCTLQYSGSYVNITGWTVNFNVWMTVNDASPTILASTSNGKVALTNPTLGAFTITLQPSDSSSIAFPQNADELDCIYDIEMIDGSGVVHIPQNGAFTIYRR